MADRGRPSLYSDELAARICERLALGESLNKICKSDPDMPDERTVRTWAAEKEEFSPKYTRARLRGYEVWADQILDISDDDNGDTQRDRLKVDSRKWLLSKYLPKVFGDKVQHTGADGNSPVIVTWQPPATE